MTTETPIQLFLDDVRQCPEGMIQCTTVIDAIQYLNQGNVEFISFSFDLMNGGSGYDVALWIENAVRNHVIPYPSWCIHSANQSGRERISHVMNAASRYWYLNKPHRSEHNRVLYGDEWYGIRALISVGNFKDEAQKHGFIQDFKTFLANSGWMYGCDLAKILTGCNPNDLVAHVYESYIYSASLSEIEQHLTAQEQLGFSTKCDLLLTLGACMAIGHAEDLLIWENMKRKKRSPDELADIPEFLRKNP